MFENKSGKHGSDKLRKLPLVSIIVPVYQVKAYIGECVDSLLCQTYEQLEIILVDDGSTDGSGEICDEYAKEHHRIRVIHQKNKGLSAARNAGLDQASGEYVAFVDSDDYVDPKYIEELYRLILEYCADLAACMFVKVGETAAGLEPQNRQIRTGTVQGIDSVQKVDQTARKADVSGQKAEKSDEGKTNDKEICLTSEQMLRQWHGKYKKWETVVWNKLYHKSIFEQDMRDKADRTGENRKKDRNEKNSGNGMDPENGKIRFPEGRKHEDVLTSHRIVGNAERIVMTTRALYLYRTREGNITSKMSSTEGRRQNLCAQRERMLFFKERGYWRAYLNLLWGYVMHLGWFGLKAVRKK